MTRFARALPIILLLVLAACSPSADATTASPKPTGTAEPTPSATPDATPLPTESESESPGASASASMIEGEGGFSWPSNTEADALFDDRFDCQNVDDGYQVEFPASWNVNAEFGDTPPCSWFAATEYEGGGPGEVPDEVAIIVFVQDGERDDPSDIIDRQEGIVGATQPATRLRYVEDDEVEYYEYVVQLGPTPEEGPSLIARTSSHMGGDYDLNQAILDRMMQTMEFIGVVQ
jgi:hypothetical protein